MELCKIRNSMEMGKKKKTKSVKFCRYNEDQGSIGVGFMKLLKLIMIS